MSNELISTYARNTHQRHCDVDPQSQSLIFSLQLRGVSNSHQA